MSDPTAQFSRNLGEFQKVGLITKVGVEVLNSIKNHKKNEKQVPKQLRPLSFPPGVLWQRPDGEVATLVELTARADAAYRSCLRLHGVRADIELQVLALTIAKGLLTDLRDEPRKKELLGQVQDGYTGASLGGLSSSSADAKGSPSLDSANDSNASPPSLAGNAFRALMLDADDGSPTTNDAGMKKSRLTSPSTLAACLAACLDNCWLRIYAGPQTRETPYDSVKGEVKEICTVYVTVQTAAGAAALEELLEVGKRRWGGQHDKIMSWTRMWKLRADFGIVFSPAQGARAERLAEYAAKLTDSRDRSWRENLNGQRILLAGEGA